MKTRRIVVDSSNELFNPEQFRKSDFFVPKLRINNFFWLQLKKTRIIKINIFFFLFFRKPENG